MGRVSHLLRIALPDVPGSLGAVATAIGSSGANIEAIEIVEHRSDGSAIDDVFIELTAGVLPDMVVSAVQRLDGVRVLWISRYAVGGNLHLDLEAIEALTEDPANASAMLVELLPRAFRADWSMVVAFDGTAVSRQEFSGGAPDLPAAAAAWFPVKGAQRLDIDRDWPGWSQTDVAAVPLGADDRVVLLGRHGGPEILDSELARLRHLATLAASLG